MAERGDDDPIERLRRAGQASYAAVDPVEYQRELRRDESAEDREACETVEVEIEQLRRRGDIG